MIRKWNEKVYKHLSVCFNPRFPEQGFHKPFCLLTNTVSDVWSWAFTFATIAVPPKISNWAQTFTSWALQFAALLQICLRAALTSVCTAGNLSLAFLLAFSQVTVVLESCVCLIFVCGHLQYVCVSLCTACLWDPLTFVAMYDHTWACIVCSCFSRLRRASSSSSCCSNKVFLSTSSWRIWPVRFSFWRVSSWRNSYTPDHNQKSHRWKKSRATNLLYLFV